MIKIGSEHPRYQENKKHYKVGQLLNGGTIAMREARDITIPQEQRETDENYPARVNRSVLFNAYRQTLEGMSLKPFTEKVSFTEDLPEKYAWMLEDIDGSGMGIDLFSYEGVKGVLHRGKYLALVDMPSLFNDDGKLMSVKEQRDGNIHPFVSLIHPDSLISYPEDDKGFTEIQIKYSKYEDVDGEIKLVNYIDHWTRKEITTHKEDKDEKGKIVWVQIESVTNTIGVIPLVVCDDIDGKPVLEDLAHLNMSHFRKSSDIDNILHVSRVPYQLFTGFEQDEIEATVSVHNAYCSDNVNADIKWIEIAGTANANSAQDLEALEERMSVYGFDLISAGKVAKTATEASIETDADYSILQSVVKSVENSWPQIMHFASLWMNDKNPPDIGLEIFKDFNITQQVLEKAKLLLSIRMAGQMSQYRFLDAIRRLKIHGDDFDINEEMGRIEEDGGF